MICKAGYHSVFIEIKRRGLFQTNFNRTDINHVTSCLYFQAERYPHVKFSLTTAHIKRTTSPDKSPRRSPRRSLRGSGVLSNPLQKLEVVGPQHSLQNQLQPQRLKIDNCAYNGKFINGQTYTCMGSQNRNCMGPICCILLIILMLLMLDIGEFAKLCTPPRNQNFSDSTF